MPARDSRRSGLVVPDEAIGRVEDRRPRPVVAPQHDDPCLAVALPELQDVADGGAAELVDRLVVVADDRHVPMALGDQRDELRLRPVGVLELVHEDVPEAALDGLARRGRVAQQPQGERDLVAEVDRPVLGEQRLVAPVGAGELALAARVLRERGRGVGIRVLASGRRRRLCAQPVRVGEIRVGRHVLVLRPGEQRRERVEEPRRVAQRPVLVQVELEQPLAQEHHGLGPREHPHVRRQAELQGELADQPVPERMERRDRRVRVPVRHELVDPDLHLVRGLVREREGQDLGRLGAPGRDQPRDPPRDDLRLARCRRRRPRAAARRRASPPGAARG